MDHSEIQKKARPLYDQRLPYHNFQHILMAVKKGEELISKFHTFGLNVEEPVVFGAIYFHDAGYHQDHIEAGFGTKEKYSVSLALEALKDFDWPERTFIAIEHAILATQKGSEIQSLEQAIVHWSDLGNLWGDYPFFLKDCESLHRERELLSGEAISIQNWKRHVAQEVHAQIAPSCKISNPQVLAVETDFRRQAKSNLDRYLAT